MLRLSNKNEMYFKLLVIVFISYKIPIRGCAFIIIFGGFRQQNDQDHRVDYVELSVNQMDWYKDET